MNSEEDKESAYMEDYRLISGSINYEISESGAIYSRVSAKHLRVYIRSNRERSVNIIANGRLKSVRVSREVYKAFITPIIKRSDRVAYKDGNPDNTHFTNLYLIKNPALFGNKRNKKRMFSDDPVREIRSLKGSYTVDALAKMYNVGKSSMARILNHYSYKDVF